MTIPPSPSAPLPVPPARRVRPGLVLLLAGMTAVICASVVLTDYLSPRDRSRPASADSQPATMRVP